MAIKSRRKLRDVSMANGSSGLEYGMCATDTDISVVLLYVPSALWVVLKAFSLEKIHLYIFYALASKF